MRVKLNSILLACAVAFVVMAVGPIAGASAETGQWYVNGAMFTGEESLNITSSGPVTFKTTITGINLVVQCELKGSSPTISDNNLDTWGFGLSGCKAVEPTACNKVSASSSPTPFTGALGQGEKGELYNGLIASESQVLTKISVTGCALEGGYKVKGVVRCRIVSPEIESVVKQCELTATSSEAKFGVNPLTLTGTIDMELAGVNKGNAWTARVPPTTPSLTPGGQWVINGLSFAGEESVKINSGGPATLTTSINGTRLVIKCESLAGKGTTEVSGNNKSSGEYEFSGCKYVEPSACSMGPSLYVRSLRAGGLEIGGASEVFENMGGPEADWLGYWISGCSLEGKYSFSGAPRCKIVHPAEESVVKQCEFLPTSSELKWGVNPANLQGIVDLELAGANKGKPWKGEY
jgi:hypothetical protein